MITIQRFRPPWTVAAGNKHLYLQAVFLVRLYRLPYFMKRPNYRQVIFSILTVLGIYGLLMMLLLYLERGGT